jgi:broad specificity phosphatase PhoE
MLTLLLVRHGMSTRNHVTDLAFQGDIAPLEEHLVKHKDEFHWPLWTTGEDQAIAAGDWIRKNYAEGFVAQIVSPFVRAVQTADLLRIPNCEWQIDHRIRERYWGEYGPETDPPYLAPEYMRDVRVCGEPTWRTRLPGGEAVIDLFNPVRDFLHELLERWSEGNVVIVTHGGTMRAMQMVLDGLTPETCHSLVRRPTDNCWIVRYELNNLKVEELRWEAKVDVVNPLSD